MTLGQFLTFALYGAGLILVTLAAGVVVRRLPGERAQIVWERARALLSSPNVVLTLAVFFFLFTIIFPMLISSSLYAIDPWRHYFFSRFGEAQHFFTNQVEMLSGPIRDSYPTVLRSNMFLYTVLSGEDPYTLVRFFSLFLRVVYFMLVYAVVQAFTGERRWAVLGTVLAMTSYYFVWRSNNTWPENQVVLMYLLALLGFERYRQHRQRRDLVLIGLALVGAIYTHAPSVYVFLMMLAGYGLLAVLEKDWVTVRAYALVVVAAVLVATPSIVELGRIFLNTFRSNFGENSLWAPTATEQDRYDPIGILSYQTYLGQGMILFVLLGVVALFRSRSRERLPVIVTFLLGFILTLSTHYSLYIPPARTMGFFFVLVIPVALIGVQALFSRLERRSLRSLFIGLGAVAAFMLVFGTAPYVEYPPSMMRMAAEVNQLLEDRPGESIGFMGGSAVMFLMDYPEVVCPRLVQTIDGHYNTSRVLDGNERCVDPTFILVSLENTRAVPGYTLLFEVGNYAVWEKRR
ncbi:MAG: hypothetical protein EPO32_03815 [Anaerolineae bacterium]|nr:MAG: hypothetical protein EPO32_03815 [Anaerolineae bacterium]